MDISSRGQAFPLPYLEDYVEMKNCFSDDCKSLCKSPACFAERKRSILDCSRCHAERKRSILLIAALVKDPSRCSG
jgi:hypothetical protein